MASYGPIKKQRMVRVGVEFNNSRMMRISDEALKRRIKPEHLIAEIINEYYDARDGIPCANHSGEWLHFVPGQPNT